MKIKSSLTDETLLLELGSRLSAVRVERNLTQAALAFESGVSKRTVERAESGEASTQLANFIRVCRGLGLLENFELLIPPSTPSPIAQLRQASKARQRVRKPSSANLAGKAPNLSSTWQWADKNKGDL